MNLYLSPGEQQRYKELEEVISTIPPKHLEKILKLLLSEYDPRATRELDEGITHAMRHLKNINSDTASDIMVVVMDAMQQLVNYVRILAPNNDELLTTSTLKATLEDMLAPDWLLNNPNPAVRTFIRDILKSFSTLWSYYQAHEIGSTGVSYDFYSIIGALIKPISKIAFILAGMSLGLDFGKLSRLSNVACEPFTSLLRRMSKMKQQGENTDGYWEFFLNNLSWNVIALSTASAMSKQLIIDRVSGVYGLLSISHDGKTLPPFIYLSEKYLLPIAGNNKILRKSLGLFPVISQEILNTMVLATIARMASELVDQAMCLNPDTQLLLEAQIVSKGLFELSSKVQGVNNQALQKLKRLSVEEVQRRRSSVDLSSLSSKDLEKLNADTLKTLKRKDFTLVLSGAMVDLLKTLGYLLDFYSLYSIASELNEALYEKDPLVANDKYYDFLSSFAYFLAFKLSNLNLSTLLALSLVESAFGDVIHNILKCDIVGSFVQMESCHSEIKDITNALEEIYCSANKDWKSVEIAVEIISKQLEIVDSGRISILKHSAEHLDPKTIDCAPYIEQQKQEQVFLDALLHYVDHRNDAHYDTCPAISFLDNLQNSEVCPLGNVAAQQIETSA